MFYSWMQAETDVCELDSTELVNVKTPEMASMQIKVEPPKVITPTYVFIDGTNWSTDICRRLDGLPNVIPILFENQWIHHEDVEFRVIRFNDKDNSKTIGMLRIFVELHKADKFIVVTHREDFPNRVSSLAQLEQSLDIARTSNLIDVGQFEQVSNVSPSIHILIDGGGHFSDICRFLTQFTSFKSVLFLDPADTNWMPTLTLKRVVGHNSRKRGQAADHQMSFYLAEIWLKEKELAPDQRSKIIEVTKDKGMVEHALEAKARGFQLRTVSNLEDLKNALRVYGRC